ncbi:hypothetical protein AB0B66_40575 [Catellatospora sp. NPDC049111]|uniref:hypothetical protein n=1 Tax=Catellatospora sp. NPDC049111 TaxID=3155271 RepID=UPI0033FAF43F
MARILAVGLSAALFVASTPLAASAAVPPVTPGAEVIQRTIFLAAAPPAGSEAEIRVADRSIHLNTGTYRWSYRFYGSDGTTDASVTRTIAITGGDYWWNCRIQDMSIFLYGYETWCYLSNQRDELGLPTAYLPWDADPGHGASLGVVYVDEVQVVNGLRGDTMTWRSELLRIT